MKTLADEVLDGFDNKEKTEKVLNEGLNYLLKPVGLNEDKAEAKQYLTQYIQRGNKNYTAGKTVPTLKPGIYEVGADMGGIFFKVREVASDELIRFEDKRFNKILSEVSRFRKMADDFAAVKMNHKRGMILYGKPGTGKSCLMKLMMEECVNDGDVVFLASSPYLLPKALEQFKEVEPKRIATVMIEEIDEVLRYGARSMSELLDGQDQVQGVLFVSTTNHLERIHPKFLREGRFDLKIEIGNPPKAGRVAYLENKIGIVEDSGTIDEIADETVDFSFAQLREFVISVYCYKKDRSKVITRIRNGGGIDESPDLSISDNKIKNIIEGGGTLHMQYYDDRVRKPKKDSEPLANKILKEF